MPGDQGNPLQTLAEASRMLSPAHAAAQSAEGGYFSPGEGEPPALTEESASRPKGAVEPPHVLAFITKAE